MKRLLLFILSLSLLLVGCTTNTTTKEPYDSLVDYYNSTTTISSLDTIIGMEALGIESDSLELDEKLIQVDSSAHIAKSLIAKLLHGDDISELVTMLESSIHPNGAIDLTNEEAYANTQVYGVYALYIIQSDQLELCTDYLASLIQDNGAFTTAWGEDVDITGWVVEALSLVNATKYKDVIDQANQYLDEHLIDDHYDGGYGGNTNTQASVLLGKLANKQEIPQEQIDYFYTFQLEDGSMYYPGSPNKTNQYATDEAALLLGNLNNGNIYTKASEIYEEIN